jgi:hypothetical protein
VSGTTVNGSTFGRGIEVLSDDVSTAVVSISGNAISNTAFNGIFANNGDSGLLDLHIRNNNVGAPLDTVPASCLGRADRQGGSLLLQSVSMLHSVVSGR